MILWVKIYEKFSFFCFQREKSKDKYQFLLIERKNSRGPESKSKKLELGILNNVYP
jgi:hypothetical protein